MVAGWGVTFDIPNDFYQLFRSEKWTLHKSKIPKEKYLKGGDLIRLEHTESNGYLMATKPFNSEYAEVYVGNYEGEYSEELHCVSAIWEVERDIM